MFAVGHVTLGYIIGRLFNKAIGQDLNIPAIWALSLLPDIDFLIPGLQHRGPTHSIIIALIIFLPFFLLRSKEAVPYFATLATHSIIGDYITDRGIMLFWPLTSEWVKFENTIRLGSTFETYIELTLFSMLILTLIVSKDFNHLFDLDMRNSVLFIPLCTIVLPAFFRYPVKIPEILIIPHLILLSIIALSFSMSLIPTASSINKKTHTLVKKMNMR